MSLARIFRCASPLVQLLCFLVSPCVSVWQITNYWGGNDGTCTGESSNAITTYSNIDYCRQTAPEGSVKLSWQQPTLTSTVHNSADCSGSPSLTTSLESSFQCLLPNNLTQAEKKSESTIHVLPSLKPKQVLYSQYNNDDCKGNRIFAQIITLGSCMKQGVGSYKRIEFVDENQTKTGVIQQLKFSSADCSGQVYNLGTWKASTTINGECYKSSQYLSSNIVSYVKEDKLINANNAPAQATTKFFFSLHVIVLLYLTSVRV